MWSTWPKTTAWERDESDGISVVWRCRVRCGPTLIKARRPFCRFGRYKRQRAGYWRVEVCAEVGSAYVFDDGRGFLIAQDFGRDPIDHVTLSDLIWSDVEAAGLPPRPADWNRPLG